MSHKLSAAGLKARDKNTSEEDTDDARPKRESKRHTEKKLSLKTYAKEKSSKTTEKNDKTPKVNEGASCSKSQKMENPSQDENSQKIQEMQNDMNFLKQSMGDILPVIKDLKTAYNKYKDEEEEEDLRDLSGWTKSEEEIEEEEEEDKEDKDEIEEGEITEESLLHFQNIARKGGKKGPKINKLIASELTNMLTEGISNENKEILYEKYNPPENCERINVVQVNSEIYKNASKPIKINEAKLTKIQDCMMKAMTALTYSYEKTMNMLQNKKGKNEKQEKMAEESADAIALIANASHMLDVYRKSNFKRGFKEEMSSICKDEPISDKLFGTDSTLTEKVKNITDLNKLANKVSRRSPYKKRRFPFLGNRDRQRGQNYQKYQQNYKANKYPKKNFKQWKYKKNQNKVDKK